MRAQLCTALLCCALSGKTVPTATGLVGTSGDPKFGAQTAPALSNDDLRATFGDVFMRWRGGDDSLLEDVRSLAAMMCTQFNRCDIPKGVEHYAALSSAERARGLELELQAEALRGRINFAFSEGLRNDEWEPFQRQIEQDIESLHELTREVADRTARAQASALRAEYYVARLEQAYSQSLDAEVRLEFTQRVEADARDAIKNFAAFGSTKGSLNPRLTLARVEYYVGQLVSAQDCFETLAKDAAQVQQDDKVAAAYEGLLMIARDRGDQHEADRCLKLLADLRDSNTDWPLAHAWAVRLLHSDRAEEAVRFLHQFQVPEEEDDSSASLEIRRHLAFTLSEAHLRTRDLPKAREQAQIAASLEGKVNVALGVRSSASLKNAEFDRWFLEARIYLAEDRAGAVVSDLRTSTLLDSLGPCEEGAARTLLGEARLRLRDYQGAKKELERALELADEVRDRALDHPLLSKDDLRRFNLIGEWEGAGLESLALLVRAHLALGEPTIAALASEEWQSKSLRGEENELGRLKAMKSGVPSGHPLEIEDLKAWASAFELGFVTWVFGSDSGTVVHVRTGTSEGLSATGAPIALGRESLRDAARRLRELAIGGLNTDAVAQEIRDALIPAGIREHIGQARSKHDRLLLLVHGPLENMPFELLGLHDQVFDEELCLVVLPGLPSPEPGPACPPEAFRNWSLLGAPIDGRDGEGPPRILLKGAGLELDSIAKLHPDAVRASGFRRADLEAALLSTRSLHVATHLEVKPGEAHSRFPAAGLRLDDGEVASAREIADLGPNLPLVVLSACETGNGRYADGEGLFGVSRAFLEGGTRNLVVTLWPIEDEAAGQFSLAFHRALAEGAAPSEATRSARKTLRAAGRKSSDWAAFRFLGRD